MIRVTVELISAIDPKRNKILGVAELSNDMTTTEATGGAYGSYRVRLSKSGEKVKETWKTGRVERFPRTARGAWDLLYVALRNIVGGRNND